MVRLHLRQQTQRTLMAETLIEDCSSFNFELNADEIEVTVLKDQVKKYRKGKSDMSGTITGINFISEMRKRVLFLTGS